MIATVNSQNTSTKDLRSFGFILGGGIGLFFGLIHPWVFNREFKLWPWALAVVLALIALAAPIGLKYIYVVWMKIGMVLGAINTRIILTVVYLVIFSPIALFFKLTRRDRLALRSDSTRSYRASHPKDRKISMKSPY